MPNHHAQANQMTSATPDHPSTRATAKAPIEKTNADPGHVRGRTCREPPSPKPRLAAVDEPERQRQQAHQPPRAYLGAYEPTRAATVCSSAHQAAPGALSQSDTWAGWRVSWTTELSSAFSVPRSTWSRSRAENASSVRWASYLRR